MTTTHKKTVPNRVLTEAEQLAALKLHLHTTQEVQSFLKPGEGFERVAPIVFGLLDHHPEIVQGYKINVAELRAHLAEASKLAELEAAAEQIRRRVADHRLELESDVYRALLRVNRYVQNAEDAALADQFQPLSDWIVKTHPGSAPREAPAAAPGPKNG